MIRKDLIFSRIMATPGLRRRNPGRDRSGGGDSDAVRDLDNAIDPVDTERVQEALPLSFGTAFAIILTVRIRT